MPVASNHSVPSDSSKCDVKHLLDFWYSHSHLDPDTWLSPRHTSNRGTRQPQPFDLHLDKSLQLKQVRYSPNILKDLSDIALQSLESRKDLPRLPRQPKLIVDDVQYDRTLKDIPRIYDEAGVAQVYYELVGTSIARIASVLELGANSWHDNLLAWFPRSAPGGGQAAVADGFLRIHEPSLEGTSQNCADKVQTLMAFFSELAVWEFKNVLVGSYAVMENIMLLSQGSFEWEICAKSKPCQHIDARRLPLVNGARMGFDSKRHSFSTNYAAWTPSPVQKQLASNRESQRKAGSKKKGNIEQDETARMHARHIVQQVSDMLLGYIS